MIEYGYFSFFYCVWEKKNEDETEERRWYFYLLRYFCHRHFWHTNTEISTYIYAHTVMVNLVSFSFEILEIDRIRYLVSFLWINNIFYCILKLHFGLFHFLYEFYSKNSNFFRAVFLHIIFTISFTTTPHYKWRWFNTHSTKIIIFVTLPPPLFYSYIMEKHRKPFCASPCIAHTYKHISLNITIIFINLLHRHVYIHIISTPVIF